MERTSARPVQRLEARTRLLRMRKIASWLLLAAALTSCTETSGVENRTPDPPPEPVPWSKPVFERGLRSDTTGCGKVVYLGYESGTRSVDVVVADPKDMTIRALLTVTALESTARWSPEARFLAFTSRSRPGSSANQLFVAAADGSKERSLTPRGRVGTNLSWAPDESQIAFEKRGAFPKVAVADLRGRRRVLGEGTEPLWSPTGEWIAFTTLTGGVKQVGIVRPDGSERRLFERPWLRVLGVDDWSTDGRYIYVSVGGGERGTGLWAFDLDGEAKKFKTGPVNRICGAACSPDGRRIAYSRQADEFAQVEVVEPGSKPIVLTGNCCNEDPDWSPDGDALVYESTRGISVSTLDPNEPPRRFADSYDYSPDPDWAPC